MHAQQNKNSFLADVYCIVEVAAINLIQSDKKSGLLNSR